MSGDEELADIMNRFMNRLRAYMATGGPEDVLDKILAAATMLGAAVLILWSPKRKGGGVFGIVSAMVRQIWDRRKYWGLP
jgi:hypothetical protein